MRKNHLIINRCDQQTVDRQAGYHSSQVKKVNDKDSINAYCSKLVPAAPSSSSNSMSACRPTKKEKRKTKKTTHLARNPWVCSSLEVSAYPLKNPVFHSTTNFWCSWDNTTESHPNHLWHCTLFHLFPPPHPWQHHLCNARDRKRKIAQKKSKYTRFSFCFDFSSSLSLCLQLFFSKFFCLEIFLIFSSFLESKHSRIHKSAHSFQESAIFRNTTARTFGFEIFILSESEICTHGAKEMRANYSKPMELKRILSANCKEEKTNQIALRTQKAFFSLLLFYSNLIG